MIDSFKSSIFVCNSSVSKRPITSPARTLVFSLTMETSCVVMGSGTSKESLCFTYVLILPLNRTPIVKSPRLTVYNLSGDCCPLAIPASACRSYHHTYTPLPIPARIRSRMIILRPFFIVQKSFPLYQLYLQLQHFPVISKFLLLLFLSDVL